MRASFQSKKRKILVKANAERLDDLDRSKSSLRDTINSIQQNQGNNESSESLRKALQQMQQVLLTEKQSRQELQQKVTKIYTRSITREDEFRRLLQQTIPLNAQKSNKVAPSKLSQIQDKLIQFFDITNKKAEEQLLYEKKIIEQQMQRRVRQITIYMENQLEHSKKLINLNFQTIHKEISQIIRISWKILSQNQNMRKCIDDFSFKNKMLRQEKDVLVQEVIEKKLLIKKMYKQLSQKYNKDDQLSQQIEILKRQRRDVDRQYEKYQRERKKKDNFINKINEIQPKAITLFTTEQLYQSAPLSPKKRQCKTISQTIETIETVKSNDKTVQPRRLLTTADEKNRQTRLKTSIRQLGKIRTVSMNESRISDADTSRIIAHLKECLKRQKKRTSDQAKLIYQLQTYQQQIDGIMKHILSQQCQNMPKQHQQKVNNGVKIYNLIKQLGRRLLKSQNPSINGGFQDINMLLEELKIQ